MASSAQARRVNDAATPIPASLAEVGGRVERRITALLDHELERWRTVDPDLVEPIAALRDLILAGGKRLRPAFCHWAFVGAGGADDDPLVVDAGAALEMLHTFALVHDDVMDGSGTRRSQPAIHRRFMTRHDVQRGRGEARRYGEGAAILVGDFAFVYADILFRTAPAVARPIFDELRVELCVGQYLDLEGTASGSSDPVRAERIERYKSGKYTVERPLQLGAALAGRLDTLAGPLSDFGLPLGEAFQMRDDLLGVFGDATVTGKPVGDDLREGKPTPLLARAVALAEPGQRDVLARVGVPCLGDDEVAKIQQVIIDTGALDELEDRIAALAADAVAALDRLAIADQAREELRAMADFVVARVD
jgi:geranylgeranyl diphosphate synthase, type I